ncbi:PilZ domain-containing protein [Colwellia psychrerythraea]|uniref:Type IV pilus assembly PilZ n=1 Tax=Colwellia psychrerythraea TaxID=28229 RepID=A0A099KK64_COLPS|nr:PilZ domain-containing protein [Colwellia psychrerythraea]KGJ90615.1 type IV pilus assembly PilZ [Colwellia psychrerythraea]
MNKDFSKHHKIIEDFRGEVSKPSFEDKFTAITGHLTRNERFLLKMELKRLAGACTRAIDLRGLVDGECQLFDFQGQSHFLDEVAINAFKENVAIYGSYTFGVYEFVKNAKNSFRNIYKNEQTTPSAVDHNKNKSSIDKLQYPAKLELLSNYPNRLEERMNFSIPITLTLANNQQLITTCIDISVNGIKFKLINEVSLFKGDQLTIGFTGLEQEFQFSKEGLLTFEVKNVLRDSGTQLIGCQRSDTTENEAFKRFLSGYIQGNKRRYKINLDNSLAALQARSLEQYALVKINELVVFMHGGSEDNVANLEPRYTLTTKNNQKLYQYWRDDKKHSTLHYLINAQRQQHLHTLQQQGKSLLVYSFIHQHKGRKFFYTVDEEQLKHDNKFFQQFLAFAASKSTFAITALKFQQIKLTQAYSPFTLSTAITKQQGYLNPPLTDEVNALIAKLPYVVTATDVTSATVISDYQTLGYEGIDLERLKSFGHKYGDNKSRVDEIALVYGHQRQEVRFKYKTPVSIECEGLNSTGQSADFSVSGLKVDLDSPAGLSKGDIVFLTFPKLQKITSAFDLKQLPYKVIRISKDKSVVNLRVSVKEHQHIGRSFFKLLIDKNKDKLTPDEYAMLTPGLSVALRTLYAVNMEIPTAVVQSSGSRYKVETLVAGQYAYQSHKNLLSAMLRLSDRDGYYNLYPLLGNSQVSNLLDQHMKKLLASDAAVSELIYIAINPSKLDIEKSVIIKPVSEFNSPEIRNFFIKKSLKQGEFYSLQLKLSRSDEAHMEHLNPELAYIGTYAIHRGKQLEQDIYSVAGLVQLVDVTQETLLRHALLN